MGTNAFECEPQSATPDASLYLRRLSEVYWKRKIIRTLDYVLHEVSDHHCLVLHCIPCFKLNARHVVAANQIFVEYMLSE